MRAKIKAPIIMKSVLKVIFDVIAELQKSVSQQTLAIMELALTYKWQNIRSLLFIDLHVESSLVRCIDLGRSHG